MAEMGGDRGGGQHKKILAMTEVHSVSHFKNLCNYVQFHLNPR